MRDAILKRVSTRTYNKQQLSSEDVKKINNILVKYESVNGPFDHMYKFKFRFNDSKSQDGKRIGTYGILRNVPGYISGTCKNVFENLVDYGFIFERIILELTKNNFDTCWLGGTFKRKTYEMRLGENEIVPAITPVGYRAQKTTIIDRFIRKAAESDNRKIFGTLFKDYNTFEPLSDTFESPIMQCLELVRKGPSASNKQPWRAYVNENEVLFYLKRTQRYPSDNFPYDIQALDIGIAISNFTAGLEYLGYKFSYYKDNKAKEVDFCDYVLTVKIDN
jgi:nitroreductase